MVLDNICLNRMYVGAQQVIKESQHMFRNELIAKNIGGGLLIGVSALLSQRA